MWLYSATAPVIVRFPRDTRVQEGEGVLFQVEVTGTPQPKLTWYHNGEEVRTDYSKELAEDGSLTMPSAELKHSGVYQLVAVNLAGRVERELKLSVESEDIPSSSAPKTAIPQGAAVPVHQLGNHVEKNHGRNNRGFRDEYQVPSPCLLHVVTLYMCVHRLCMMVRIRPSPLPPVKRTDSRIALPISVSVSILNCLCVVQ